MGVTVLGQYAVSETFKTDGVCAVWLDRLLVPTSLRWV